MSGNPRDVVARISLDPSRYEAGAERASLATKQMLRQQEAADRKFRAMATAQGSAIREDEARQRAAAASVAEGERRKQAAYQATGKVLMTGSAAVLGALAYSVKAAVSWESAWAGVTKTVDGTHDEMVRLEKDLRLLAMTLPASHAQIAAVAELAGQLGVEAKNVASFTRVMIDLGETTNLSATDAASSLAKFANVMQTTSEDTSRLGSTIVALGNNSATTEADIVAMASRLAAAGKQAKLSESDVFAYASALSSVGVEAEAGGTAVSKVFTSIGDAVRDGGSKLETFAKVSGVSVEQFRAAFEQDAAGAIAMFIEGMGRASEAGESTTQIFGRLELTDERLKRSILSLGSAQGLLGDQLALANGAWDENTALLIEAAKRYDTTESKIAIARNSIQDSAITIGDAFIPALAAAADGVADFAQWVGSLDPALLEMIAKLAGVAATGGLVVGALLLIAPRLVETYRLMRQLSVEAPRAATGIKNVGKAAGIAAAAMAVMAGVNALNDSMQDTAAGAEATTRALLGMAQDGGVAVDELFNKLSPDKGAAALFRVGAPSGIAWLEQDIKSLEDAVDRIVSPSFGSRINDVAGEIWSFGGSEGSASRTQLIEQFNTMGNALAAMVQGGQAEQAAAQYQVLHDAWVNGGGAVEDLNGLMPAYTEALAAAETEQESTESSAQALAESMGYTGEMTEEAAQALQKWRDTVSSADADFISLGDAYDTLTDRSRTSAEEMAEGTKTVEDSWEDFISKFPVTVDDYLAELERQVDAQRSWEDDMVSLSDRVATSLPSSLRDAAGEMIDELAGMGPKGAEQVALFNSMTDEELAKLVSLWGNKGTEATSAFTSDLESARNPVIDVEADTVSATREVDSLVRDIEARNPIIDVTARVRGPLELPPSLKTSDVPARANGGRLPGPPSSRDNMLIWAASGEYVVNANATKGNLALLEAINSGRSIDQALASGGRVGWARRQRDDAKGELKEARQATKTAQRALDGLGSKASASEKKSARSKVDRARKAERDAEKALRAAEQRIERLADEERERRVDVRRGETVERVQSGLSGAYSVIDEMLDASRNKDYSAKQRKEFKRAAREAEKELTKLYKRAEAVEEQLAGARDRVSELAQISGAVSSALQGEQSLAASVTKATEDETTTVQRSDGRGNIWHESTTKKGQKASVTAGVLVADARSRAGKIKAFAEKLKKLADLGTSGTILQEIALLGSEEGGVIADALIAGGKPAIEQLNQAYADIEKHANSAGQYVTEGFAEGGLKAAEEFVKTLEKEQERIAKAIGGAGKALSKEFLDGLGLKVDKKGKIVKKAMGGRVVGPGTGTSDSVLMAASNGEFVINARSTSKYEPLLSAINNDNEGLLSSFALRPAVQTPNNINVAVTVPPDLLARALDGASLTLMVDGQPVRGIVRAELADVARSARYTTTRGY